MPVIEAECASMLVPHDHRHINQKRTTALMIAMYKLGCHTANGTGPYVDNRPLSCRYLKSALGCLRQLYGPLSCVVDTLS